MSDQALNLNDFENVIRLIDMAAQRGAIRGEEMGVIGTLRSKFVSFLEQNSKDQNVKQSGQPEPQTGEQSGEKEYQEYPATDG